MWSTGKECTGQFLSYFLLVLSLLLQDSVESGGIPVTLMDEIGHHHQGNSRR